MNEYLNPIAVIAVISGILSIGVAILYCYCYKHVRRANHINYIPALNNRHIYTNNIANTVNIANTPNTATNINTNNINHAYTNGVVDIDIPISEVYYYSSSSSGDEDSNCFICWKHLSPENGEIIFLECCCSRIHENCFLEWLKGHNGCPSPYCQQDIIVENEN